MRSANNRKYWFPARRYGWGWGLPSAWQGWVVLIAYLALILGSVPLIHVAKGSMVYIIAYVSIFTVALVIICWLTGEPPRWRWGKRDA